jgi:hypothetical protein
MKISTIVAAAALVAATAAPAATKAGQPEQDRPAVTAAGGEKKICKRLERTGTRLGTKERACHTREEWKKIEEMD